MSVSIIIPAYNVENHISMCLDSLINQTLKDIEIIVVNDGSTDNTQYIIDEYKKKDSRIISIYQENLGPGEARNTGIRIAKGQYIGFSDSDDSVDENMYFELYNTAKISDSDIISCNFVQKCVDGSISHKIYNINKNKISLLEVGLANFIKEDVITYAFGSEVWSKLIRASIIKENNITFKNHKEILGEDMLFLLECLLETKSVEYVDLPLYMHTIRQGSLTNSSILNMSKRLMNLVDTFVEIAKSKKKYDLIEEAIPYLIYNYINTSIAHEKGFKNKYNSLISVCDMDIFRTSVRCLSYKKDVGRVKNIFGILCLKKHYYIVIIYRIIIQFIIKICRR
jgi:glycosyltransferase involved in cell wall biosynthesis